MGHIYYFYDQPIGYLELAEDIPRDPVADYIVTAVLFGPVIRDPFGTDNDRTDDFGDGLNPYVVCQQLPPVCDYGLPDHLIDDTRLTLGVPALVVYGGLARLYPVNPSIDADRPGYSFGTAYIVAGLMPAGMWAVSRAHGLGVCDAFCDAPTVLYRAATADSDLTRFASGLDETAGGEFDWALVKVAVYGGRGRNYHLVAPAAGIGPFANVPFPPISKRFPAPGGYVHDGPDYRLRAGDDDFVLVRGAPDITIGMYVLEPLDGSDADDTDNAFFHHDNEIDLNPDLYPDGLADYTLASSALPAEFDVVDIDPTPMIGIRKAPVPVTGGDV